MAETKISWADFTFNPWIGCTKISPACDNCYAEAYDKRYGGEHWGPRAARRRTSENNWKLPLRWNRKAQKLGVRYRVFCASLADVFDNRVPKEWREDLWALIRATPHLDWMLLTKRPQNIKKMLPDDWCGYYPNVWLGVTAENQTEYDRRKAHLLTIPAKLRFLSCEPLIAPIDLGNLTEIHLVIAGGESGPNARPTHPDWIRRIRDKCAPDVWFHFKQWGEWAPLEHHKGRRDWFIMEPDHGEIDIPDGRWPHEDEGECAIVRVGKAKSGDTLDGVRHGPLPEIN